MKKSNGLKIAIAVTGASGAIYAKRLFTHLQSSDIETAIAEVGVVFSANAKAVWEYELQEDNFKNTPFSIYDKDDFFAPFASGSAGYDVVIICPCSMGTMGRIASGTSGDLIGRMADVALKERKTLILVIRDTPYNLIHIENMKTITLCGGIICPATPSFYARPNDINQVADTVIERVLDLAKIKKKSFRWSSSDK